jgi:DNA-binding transcriptional LysR family regulator
METHHSRHVIAVAETGHFGRAAQELGIAQPALSQSIQRIERRLGVRLFKRGRQGAVLTSAGEAFMSEARAVLAAAERAVSLAKSAAEQTATVRIGFNSAAPWSAIPRMVAAAQAMRISLHHMTTDDQIAALVDGRLDLGFLSPPFEAPTRMTVYNLPAEPLMAALPASRRAANKLSLAEICGRTDPISGEPGTCFARRHHRGFPV